MCRSSHAHASSSAAPPTAAGQGLPAALAAARRRHFAVAFIKTRYGTGTWIQTCHAWPHGSIGSFPIARSPPRRGPVLPRGQRAGSERQPHIPARASPTLRKRSLFAGIPQPLRILFLPVPSSTRPSWIFPLRKPLRRTWGALDVCTIAVQRRAHRSVRR
ncbi:hypothetical protein GY45DRAFT_1004186 [Cubamyces sp. BRFM 1775]|nr:hypothetical protein GY45DRAFT_1004186 [Cubamyces sp. BRFM 1775]